jgi:hypothetical protein
MPLVVDSRAATLGYGRIPTGLISSATRGSLYFDGRTSLLMVNNDVDFRLGTGDFTVEWFQRLQQDTANPTVISLGPFGTNGLAITQNASFSTQQNVIRPGDAIFVWPPSSIVSTYNDVTRVLDSLSTTKYVNSSRYEAGFLVRPSSQTIVNRIGFTTANDRPECDPLLFTLEGIRDIQTNQASSTLGVWSNPFGAGATNFVNEIAILGNTIYYAGSFTSIGGIPANYIAQWDGRNWSTLGSGLDFSCESLTIHKSTLFAGGGFVNAGGIASSRVAAWNISTSTWSSVATNINNSVNVVRALDEKLYIGGAFTAVEGVTMNRIAVKDLQTNVWTTLGTGMNDLVYDIVPSSTTVYATGSFTTAGGTSANRIARWGGSSWTALGTGLDGIVLSMALDGSNLYVGGGFGTAGGITANYVARWNVPLSTWNSMGSGTVGTNNQVNGVLSVGGDLYASGFFTTAGGISANYIARWNGSTWSSVGSGANALVNCLAVSGNSLYVGGNFTQMSGVSTTRIAVVDISPFTVFSGNVYGGPFEPIAVNVSTNCSETRLTKSFSVNLSNTTPYAGYRIRFPQLRNDLAAGSLLQLTEVEMVGSTIQNQAQVVVNGSTIMSSFTGPVLDKWSHFVIQRLTNTVSLLQDGRFLTSTINAYNFTDPIQPLYIGKMNDVYNTTSTILSTTSANSISAFSSLSGGYIQHIGSQPPFRKGIVWGTAINPTVLLSSQQSYNGISYAGTYISPLTNLEPSTLYYARAFTTGPVGTSYGNQVAFLTNPWSPYVSSISLSGISSGVLTSIGSIVSTNGSTVTTRGFVWDTASTPTIALSTKTVQTGIFDIGPFSTVATGLLSNTNYFFRAYAINGVGIGYGNLIQTELNPYTIVLGVKAPIGSAGMTQLQEGSVDDTFSFNLGTTPRTMLFSLLFYGITYTQPFFNSNTYITFGSGTGQYSGLSLNPASPALPSICLGSADNSWQRCWERSTANWYRFRYEGNGSTGGTPGSPGIVYELTFFKQFTPSSDIYIEIVFGVHNRTGGIWGMTNGVNPGTISTAFGSLTSGTGLIGSPAALTANRSYVLVLTSTGQFKNLYSGYYVNSTV